MVAIFRLERVQNIELKSVGYVSSSNEKQYEIDLVFCWKGKTLTSKTYILQYMLIKELVWRSVFICSAESLKKKAGILFGISVGDSEYDKLEKCLQSISDNKDLVSIFFFITQCHNCISKKYSITFSYTIQSERPFESEKHKFAIPSASGFKKKSLRTFDSTIFFNSKTWSSI